MSEVQGVASLHEKAVQKVARGEHVAPKAKRARRTTRPASSRVRTIWPDPSLDERLVETLNSMNVTPAHVQVVSPLEVVVWNHEAPWPA